MLELSDPPAIGAVGTVEDPIDRALTLDPSGLGREPSPAAC